MARVRGGFQPDTKSESARRADFDLLRRIAEVERSGGGPPHVDTNEVTIDEAAPTDTSELWVDPTPTPALYAKINGTWTLVGTGGTGGGEVDEVWVGTTEPTDPAIELWYDPDASGAVAVSELAYTHVQGLAASSWIIEHNLGWFPNVTVIDSGGATVEGDLAHIDVDTLTLTFSAAFAGTAYLS